MSYTKERETFIATAAREGLDMATSLKLLRYATRLQRLALAQSNGDWPADNGERKTKECPQCACYWVPSSFVKGLCPDCHASQAVQSLIPPGFGAVIGSDPRGAVLILTVPSGAVNDFANRGIAVPARGTN